MPGRHARSETRGRPPFRRRGRIGNNGWTDPATDLEAPWRPSPVHATSWFATFLLNAFVNRANRRDIRKAMFWRDQLGPDRVGRLSFSHRHRPKELLSLISIVRPAAQLKIVDHGLAARSKRNHVMDLEKAALATAAIVANKRALRLVARPHSPPYRSGHVARSWPSRGRPPRT
jgi:hypothetical protein